MPCNISSKNSNASQWREMRYAMLILSEEWWSMHLNNWVFLMKSQNMNKHQDDVMGIEKGEESSMKQVMCRDIVCQLRLY